MLDNSGLIQYIRRPPTHGVRGVLCPHGHKHYRIATSSHSLTYVLSYYIIKNRRNKILLLGFMHLLK